MVRPALLLPALVALSACASAGPGDGRGLTPGVPVTMSAGESVALPDASRLTYLGVRSDSRCPPNVQCIQAGNATVAFRHDDRGASHEFELVTLKQESADIGGWRVTLVGLDFESPPKATIRVDRR